jgi:tetratricopeptide (TPR) repeat protein
LEIAASLLNAFTPAQLLKNLENRLELLRSRRRDMSERHRSLRAAIDYSFELLTPEAQSFFASLAVFRGGFTIEAASKVCLPGDEWQAMDARRRHAECLRLVLDLQERSLVHSADAPPDSPARFRLLECFREYGCEHLSDTTMDAVRLRHAEYMVELSTSPERTRAGARPDGDQENRLAAIELLSGLGRVGDCLAVMSAIERASRTARETIFALAKSSDFELFEPAHQARLLRLLANGHLYASEFEESFRLYQRALEIALIAGAPREISSCYRGLAANSQYMGRVEEALEKDRKSLEFAQLSSDASTIETAYLALGDDLWLLGRKRDSLGAFQNALEFSKLATGGDPQWAALYNLARVYLDLGSLDEGLSLASEGIRMARARDDEFGVSMCLSMVSRYHRLKGSYEASLATSREALIKRRRVGFHYWNLNGIQAHGVLLACTGDYSSAVTLLAAAKDARQSKGRDDDEYAEAVGVSRSGLTESAFERAWAAGLTMTLDEALQKAIGA